MDERSDNKTIDGPVIVQCRLRGALAEAFRSLEGDGQSRAALAVELLRMGLIYRGAIERPAHFAPPPVCEDIASRTGEA